MFWQKKKTTVTPSVPHGNRLYVLPDIHGRADLLERVQHNILQDMAQYPAHQFYIIYLGDYIDRGMDSKRVVDLILDFNPPRTRVIPLKGNHEAVLLDFFKNPTLLMDWMNFGASTTFASYGVSLDNPYTLEIQLQLAESLHTAIPTTHHQFYENLGHSFEMGDYFFVHAGVRPARSLKNQHPHDLLWIREPFLNHQGMLEKIIVHGHTVMDHIQWHKNRIGLDTGAYKEGGVLNCLVLMGEGQVLLPYTGA
jgi:serine/threonine protein phosphatase 1